MVNFLPSSGTFPVNIVVPDVETKLSVLIAENPFDPIPQGESFGIAGTLQRLDTLIGVPGATITISYNGVNVGTAVTNSFGIYSITTSIPTAGSYTLRASFAGMTTPGLTLRASNASFPATIGKPSALPILAILGVAYLFLKK